MLLSKPPAKKVEEEEVKIPLLEANELCVVPNDFLCMRYVVEWTSKENAITSDLDLNLYCYDERARLVEKIDKINSITKDSSFQLVNKVETGIINSHTDCIKIDFRLVSPSTTAILLYLDGGPRNFQFLQSVSVTCIKASPERNFGEFLPDDTNGLKSTPIFKIFGRTRKHYQGLALCVLFKQNNISNEIYQHQQQPQCSISTWATKCFLEPMFVSSEKAKEDRCTQLVIQSVPCLDKFKPRLFSNVRDICAALSSHSLPKLKKKFQKSLIGLPIGQFTEVLFKQLYENFPGIIEESEAPYNIAMLQELFYQIDYNGDSNVNWDEFTTFCVQIGIVTNNAAIGFRNDAIGNFSLDQYVIEYGEDILHRDHVLSAYRFVSTMHHVPDIRKLLVISEDSDNVLILDENFRLHAQIFPSKIQIVGSYARKEKEVAVNTVDNNKIVTAAHRAVIYDVAYLSVRDMFAFSASDHSITICKELSSLGGKKINYLQHNRFYHNLLHLKVCWSGKQDLLCTTASDQTIYGWNIDTSAIIFQIQRHTDNITDFICLDALDLFITCSMDKRIVLWSTVSRRVKGILLGHKRGVRCLSVYETTLLSAGFECEARTWDIVSKDNVAILKGHKHPVSAAKLMCDRAQSEKEYRAITVDESGEFRLWNIYVREKASETVFVPTLQTFEMVNKESPLNKFRFLAVPFNSSCSTSYYSDIIACSTKLLHFLPEKNVKEFIPPTSCIFNETISSLTTAVGKNLLTYDLSNGEFSDVFTDVTTTDVTFLCLDGERGRRMFVGNVAGELLLINSMTGLFIDSVHYHTKDITAIRQVVGARNCIYTSSLDGHLRVFEENGGKIHMHNSLDNAFGEGIGILCMKVVPSLKIIVAASLKKTWGLWHEATFKKMLVIHEEELVTAIEIIGASRDKEEEAYKPSNATKNASTLNAQSSFANLQDQYFLVEKDNILSIAVAMSSGINIYTFDVLEMRGILSLVLQADKPFYYTEMTLLKSPDTNSVNYSTSMVSSVSTGSNEGFQLVATTDDGMLLVWDIGNLRYQIEKKFKKKFKGVPLSKKSMKFNAEYIHELESEPILLKYKNSGVAQHAVTNYNHIIREQELKKKLARNVRIEKKPPRRSTNNENGSIGSELSSSTMVSMATSTTLFSTNNDMKLPYQQQQLQVLIPPPKITTNEKQQQQQSLLTSIKSPIRKSPTLRGMNKLLQTNNSNNLSIKELSTLPKQASSIQLDAVSQMHKANLTISWIEMRSSRMFLLPRGQKTATELHSYKSWIAHGDAIPLVVPMNPHSCLVTVSLDGYHRIWNLQQECLGELILPNITEQMKSHSICKKDQGGGWRFILERISIRKHHVDVAYHLVKSIQQLHINYDKNSTVNGALKNKQQQLLQNKNKKYDSNTVDDSEQPELKLKNSNKLNEENDNKYNSNQNNSELRKSMIGSLKSDEHDADDAPPKRLPTKEEKELVKFSLNLSQLSASDPNEDDDYDDDDIGFQQYSFRSNNNNSAMHETVRGGLMELSSVLEVDSANNAEHAADQSSLATRIDVLNATAPGKLETSFVAEKLKPGSSQMVVSNQNKTNKKSLTKSELLVSNDVAKHTTGTTTAKSLQRDGRNTLSATATKQQRGGALSSSSTLKPKMLADLKKSLRRSFHLPQANNTNNNINNKNHNNNNNKSIETINATLNSNHLLDSSVLMSAFGVPSIWFEPGEKDIFGNPVQKTKCNVPDKKISPAFSESSLFSGLREGIIDSESLRILRKVASDVDKVSVYDRSQPTLLLRNPAMSTKVELPSLDNIRKTEIYFGPQKVFSFDSFT